jgi:hypothetical protein
MAPRWEKKNLCGALENIASQKWESRGSRANGGYQTSFQDSNVAPIAETTGSLLGSKERQGM